MKKSLYIFIILFTILFIALISVIVLVNRPNTNISNSEQNNVPSNLTIQNEIVENLENTSIFTNSSEVKLSPNCKITFVKHYLTCGHTIKNTENISNDLVNLSRDDFSKLYSDWTIKTFDSSIVELSKDIPDYCQEHYVAKDLDGHIAIYSIDLNNNLSLIKQTDILTKYLTEGDTQKLYNGVTIYGNDNLNSFLEDFE